MKKESKPPSMRELLSALGEHVHELRPSINPKPKKRQITAAGMTARVVNSSMTSVRTSLQAKKAYGDAKCPSFLKLEEV